MIHTGIVDTGLSGRAEIHERSSKETTQPQRAKSVSEDKVERKADSVGKLVRNLNRGTTLADKLEVAESGPRRSKGLLGRKEFRPGEGLWIVPCEAVHTFFMQFPIDLVYLDRKYRVRKVRAGVLPWRISGCLSAHSVLELPAGTIRNTKTERGDALEIGGRR